MHVGGEGCGVGIVRVVDSEVWAVVSGRMLSPATEAGKAEGGAGFEEGAW